MASIVYLNTSFVFHIKIYGLWICFKIKDEEAVLTMGVSATSLSLPFSYFQNISFHIRSLTEWIEVSASVIIGFPFVQDKIQW